ncbi:MAG: hypothetical protein A2342_04655 [Gallionellales bacterium RIFOXYB12_FULL_54_9]|nr:MAG: hypothetical protein A2342_04655 [Gallionellales bacterium RIFOXYB12_FULL_54_9]
MSVLEENLGYFARQQCSAQWRAFLTAFAVEFGQQIPVAELRVLMARLGTSMAQGMRTPTGNTITELEGSINAIWLEMNWGWANLTEKADGLFIEHHVAPLQAAFGEQALTWSPAILEGVYAHWFSVISASSALQLVQVDTANPDAFLITFRFGRAV